MKNPRQTDPLEVSRVAGELGSAIPLFPKKLLSTDLLTRSHRLPLSQLQLLLTLSRGEASIGQISALLGIAKPNVSPIVDQLQQAGLVRRRRSEADRRIVSVCLTPDGEEKVAAIRKTLEEQAGKWQQNLSAARYRELQKSLASLVSILEELQ